MISTIKLLANLFLGLLFFGSFVGCVTESASKSNSAKGLNISEEIQEIEKTEATQLIDEEKIKPIFHITHEPKKKKAPFSDAVQVGNTFYLSGQIGMNHSTRTLVAGGIKAETQQIFKNISSVLFQHKMSLKDIVKVTVILDDINEFNAFNEVYTIRLPQKPARTTFAAEALARGAKVEIEVIAVKSSNSIIIHG